MGASSSPLQVMTREYFYLSSAIIWGHSSAAPAWLPQRELQVAPLPSPQSMRQLCATRMALAGIGLVPRYGIRHPRPCRGFRWQRIQLSTTGALDCNPRLALQDWVIGNKDSSQSASQGRSPIDLSVGTKGTVTVWDQTAQYQRPLP